jgi:hypothetical protein
MIIDAVELTVHRMNPFARPIAHGRLRAVNPLGCHGCAARPKRECIALLGSEFPRFGAGAATGDES